MRRRRVGARYGAATLTLTLTLTLALTLTLTITLALTLALALALTLALTLALPSPSCSPRAGIEQQLSVALRGVGAVLWGGGADLQMWSGMRYRNSLNKFSSSHR